MRTPKQIIVMRKDLNMRKGKMIAQGAHASMKILADWVKQEPTPPFPQPLKEWLDGKFTKICVSVNTQTELEEVYNKAKEAGVLCALIEDSGLTEFKNVPTLTCCAVGPDYPEKLDPITGHLPLL